MKLTAMRKLTPTIVKTLIRRIGVHNHDRYDGHCHVKVNVYFTAVEMMSLPTEQEIKKLIAEISENLREFRFTRLI